MNSSIAKTIAGLLALCLLAFAGCGKKAPAVPPAYEVSGVKIDIPKLQQAMQGAPQETQTDLNQTTAMLRYGQYARALESADKLASNPNLNDAQKKAAAEVVEQLKQLINKAGTTRQ
jgi:hypothetical protein